MKKYLYEKAELNFTEDNNIGIEAIFTPTYTFKIVSNLLKNIATDSNVFNFNGKRSITGAIIASPSREEDPETNQNYMFDWTRDSALIFTELAHYVKEFPNFKILLRNYFDFVTKTSDKAHCDQAKWFIDGAPVLGWGKQADSPGLRIIALDALYTFLTKNQQKQCNQIIAKYLNWILNNFDKRGENIWEEVEGNHFFSYAINYQALHILFSKKEQYKVTNEAKRIQETITKLIKAKKDFIQGTRFKSNMDGYGKKGNDLNIDTVFGLLISNGYDDKITDSRSLNNVVALINYFKNRYAINKKDEQKGLGISIGRYPFDMYDGITDDGVNNGHPWFISTLTVATFLYKVASSYKQERSVTIDKQNKSFFDFIGFATLGTYDVKHRDFDIILKKIVSAANKQVFSARYHAGDAHMSEQYDRDTGIEMSVRDLSWSYKEYLTALRAYHTYLKS